MTRPITSEVTRLSKRITEIARHGRPDLADTVESYLSDELKDLAREERVVVIEEIIRHIEGMTEQSAAAPEIKPAQSKRLVSLLLGKGFDSSSLSPDELSAKLAKSLNTVFDTLNQIVAVINSTLLGSKGEQETIRHIIGAEMKGERVDRSLQEYLDQVQEAFLIAHKAFRQAAEEVIRQIFSELDPGKLAPSNDGLLRFGPLRKAELFEVYREKFQRCENAFETGRLAEALLREFEKACQKFYKMETRRKP
jgi:hypothetical protein